MAMKLACVFMLQSILKRTMDSCTDITTFLRDNSAAPKLLSAYTRCGHWALHM